MLLLQFNEVALARQRQSRQGIAGDHLERIDPRQMVKIMMRRFLGMGDLTRQLVHQLMLALVRIAGFERVVVAHLVFSVFSRSTATAAVQGLRSPGEAAK
jgi:hypothetical protein